MESPSPILITCAGIAGQPDAAGSSALLAEALPGEDSETVVWRIHATGPLERVLEHPLARDARRFDLSSMFLAPGFVNAHTHLDLTHIGPVPFDAGRSSFVDWIDLIRQGRHTEEAAIARSVDEGIARSLKGGVVAMGDIAGVGSDVPLRALRESPLLGVSFIELFGLGDRQRGTILAAEELLNRTDDRANGVARALQPHAPYSAGTELYEFAANAMRDRGLPVSTHLAETREELELLASGGGAMANFLDSLGLFDDESRAGFGRGRHPIEHLESAMAIAPFLLAHVNDCPVGLERMLAERGATVVYCPRAHEYFGQDERLGPHPYRRLLEAGVPVALGTDSIVNLPRNESDHITPLDDARLLFARDGVDPDKLFSMITTVPARALGLDERLFTLDPRTDAAAINIFPVDRAPSQSAAESILRSDSNPALVLPGEGALQTLESLRASGR